MKSPDTLQQAIQFFSDYENCRQFMIAVRWPDGKVRCPICDSEKVTYLENARLYRCYGDHPKQKFSLKVGTVFEDSPIGLDKWLPAVWLLVSCKNGISSYEVAAALGITQKSAWFMMHRIRLAMQSGSFGKLGGSGEVEADETFIGGKARNMHISERKRRITGTGGDLRGGDWQGGRNGLLILCVGSAGSGLPLPRLRPFFGVEFRLDFRVRHGNQSPHKIRELAEVACGILRGTLWAIRHD